MKSISDLIKNHKVPGIRASEERRICAGAASMVLQTPITPTQVRLKEGVLRLSIPSILKTELLLKEEELKKVLRSAGISITSIG